LPSCAAAFTRPQGSSGIPHGRDLPTSEPGPFRIRSCPGQARCRLPRSRPGRLARWQAAHT